ncbi:redox-sensing transcriptional repressor Rex [Lacrimispora indolis]|uniref:redox-sensing transcriptional repressor Rex n=1 Tax=Lacrimispora indolis TaxID=69825 RepID=UPI00045E97B8|nr:MULTISPECIES: redox-sensing transcriptional repressor Rex [Lachnospiraceae]MBE7721703.1 redox-sensing transcriptional repressor Rex [Lacrimispora celerecrescens]
MEEKKNMVGGISRKTLERLPMYHHYLERKCREGTETISAPAIALDLRLNEVQVRKDLAMVAKTAGKPKMGYLVKDLIRDMEEFLGFHNTNQAALVGVGSLGKALLSYKGFEQYGVEIVLAFDSDGRKVNTKIGGKPVFPIEKLENLCQRMNIHIGIITVPAEYAQEVCNRLVAGGVRAIWNFAPTHLAVPGHVLVQNENMAVSLAALSKYLYEADKEGGQLAKEEDD